MTDPLAAETRFMIAPDRWYAWQMMPGYATRPYFSPIFVWEADGMRTGRSIMRLRFFNAFYAAGVQDFDQKLQILDRTQKFLYGRIVDSRGRGAIISDVSYAWLDALCPEIIRQCAKLSETENIQQYLARICMS